MTGKQRAPGDVPVINIADLPMRTGGKGRGFASRSGRVGAVLPMRDLGAQYLEVPPGKSAFPRHNHHANEEFFVILAGHGTYRRGDERWPVGPGDLIAAPAGGAGTAHILTNTGSEELRYLVVSTRRDPDVLEYPDSGKMQVIADVPAGQGMMSAGFRHIFRLGPDQPPAPDYWDGEPEAGE